MQNSPQNDNSGNRKRAAGKQGFSNVARAHHRLGRALLDSIAWDSRQRERRKRLGLE